MDADQAERFWSKVALGNWLDCWLWTGSSDQYGYGTATIGGRSRRAHIVAYEDMVGLVPEGCELDHVKAWGCASRACVNPLHLEPVSHLENVRRGSKFHKTHCINDHELTPENTYVTPDEHWECRICRRLSNERVKARRLAGVQ